MTQQIDLPFQSLPATVRDFVAAHVAGDDDTASSSFTEDVVLVDQGQTLHGREEALAFLRAASSQFEYTVEQTGARRIDATHWTVTLHLVGDFPGGVADLDYRFTLRDDLVAELVIGNHEA